MEPGMISAFQVGGGIKSVRSPLVGVHTYGCHRYRACFVNRCAARLGVSLDILQNRFMTIIVSTSWCTSTERYFGPSDGCSGISRAVNVFASLVIGWNDE